MKKTAVLLLSLGLTAVVSCRSAQPAFQTEMDSATAQKVNTLLSTVTIPGRNKSHGERVRDLSAAFLGTPYQADTLKGSALTPEVLVANFNGVDCYTLIDYVEALTRATSADNFLTRLIRVRYVNDKVSYMSRKHFFTDWYAISPHNAEDITRSLSPAAIAVEKTLNRKADGGEYIAGLGSVPRTIAYLPGNAISQQVLDKLHTGDYVGVYSPLAGLDVSHTGIVIKRDGQVWYRNASSLSRNMRVVDTPFLEYMAKKPGIVVLRVN